MNFKKSIVVLLVLLIITITVPGCVDSPADENTVDNPIENTPDIVPEIQFYNRSDETPVAEYVVPVEYSSRYDEWMADTAEENRKYLRDELHLFTFQDGKQFEYYLNDPDAQTGGYLYESAWTETPDESIALTPITKEEFENGLETILSEYDGAYYEWRDDEKYDDSLYIYTNESLELMALPQQAELLKGYVDSNPEKDKYFIIFESPKVAHGYKKMSGLLFIASEYKIIHITGEYVFGTQTALITTMWSDATYTSIVNAMDTGTFTNHPGKYSEICG